MGPALVVRLNLPHRKQSFRRRDALDSKVDLRVLAMPSDYDK